MKGFSGKIELMVGFLQDGTINNTAVVSHKETPGLGDKMDIKKITLEQICNMYNMYQIITMTRHNAYVAN